MNSKLETSTGYHNPVHNDFIKSLYLELVTLGEHQATLAAKRNAIVTLSDYRVDLHNQVQARIQHAIEYNHKTCQPVSIMVTLREIDVKADDELAELYIKENETSLKLKNAQNEAKTIKQRCQSKCERYLVRGVQLAIAAAEGILSFQGFRQILPVMYAGVAGLGVTGIIGLCGPILATYINKGVTSSKRVMRTVIVLGVHLVGFCLIGYLRAQAYNDAPLLDPEGVSTAAGAVSGFSLALISFFMYWAQLIISRKFARTSEQELADKQYEEKTEAVKNLAKELDAIQNAAAQIKKEAEEKKHHARAKCEYAIGCEAELVAIANTASGAYFDKYKAHRKDGQYPEFFVDPPSYNFRTFFEKMKTQ